MSKKYKISAADFRVAVEENQGYCTACNDITADYGIEPDAEGYHCSDCRKNTVCGVEQALILGYLNLSFDDESDSDY